MIGVPSSYRYPDGDPPPDESPAGELPPLGVPAWAPLLAVLVVLIGGALVAALVGSAFGLAGGDDDPERIDAADVLLNIFALDAVLIAAPIVVVLWLTRRRPVTAAFGLRVPNWRQALRATAAVYGGFWLASLIIGLIAGAPEDQTIARELKDEDSVALLAGIAIMTCVAAPLAEEFFFRGFLFRVLWERINVSVATVVSSLAFGLVHAPDADWVGVAVLTCFGAGLCLLLWRTASLLPCIMLHAIQNSISFSYTKGLPWWGYLLLTAASVATTLAIALLAVRLTRRAAAPPPVPA